MPATSLLALALLAAGPTANRALTCLPPGPLAAPAMASVRAPVADTLTQLYASGRTWDAFLAGAAARRATWTANYGAGPVDADLAARAAAVPGRWRFLVVAEDWCGDSANTIPFLARLVEQAPNLELRIVNSTEGRSVMEAHRTEDGRAATPTVVLLDESGAERGCWIERPYALRKVVADLRAGVTSGNLVDVITAWRAEDAGRSTVRDLVDLLEGAAAGTARCP